MKKHSLLKKLSLLALIGFVSALAFSACKTEDSSKSEHPKSEHPK